MAAGKRAAIVLAAGSGTRMHSAVKKQFLTLQGKPVLWFSLKLFDEAGINDIILVTGSEDLDYCRRTFVEEYGFDRIRSVVAGGKERWNSVENGLMELLRLGYGEGDIVLIHDGARPFADLQMVERLIRQLGAEATPRIDVFNKSDIYVGPMKRDLPHVRRSAADAGLFRHRRHFPAL